MPSRDVGDLSNVLIGWADTREARRAIFDALPLLRHTRRICICEIVPKHDEGVPGASVRDVVGWLKRNDVMVEPVLMALHGDPALTLLSAANDQGAGVIIAGAYGHGKLHERVLGGVTNELLGQSQKCLFLSH